MVSLSEVKKTKKKNSLWRRQEEKLTRFEDLNDDRLIVLRVDSFVDFRVLASSDLLDDLVVVLRLELNFKVVVVGVVWHFLGHLGAHICVIFGSRHSSCPSLFHFIFPVILYICVLIVQSLAQLMNMLALLSRSCSDKVGAISF